MTKKILLLALAATFALGLNAQSGILNSDFEIWSYGKPVNWTVGLHGNLTISIGNIPVEVNFGTQSNDAHSGSSAVRLASADFTVPYTGYSINMPGILQAGESDGFSIPLQDLLNIVQLLQDSTGLGNLIGNLDSADLSSLASLVKLLSNGVPCDSTPTGVSAWVKYESAGALDQMVMLAVTKKNGVPTDYAYKTFNDLSATGYQQVGISFSAPGAECDSIMIVLLSAMSLNSDAVLYVDDVGLDYSTDGIASHNAFPGRVYPNPASDRLHLHPYSDLPYTWTLTDLTGKTLLSGEAVGETDIDVKECANGVYLLHLDGDGISGSRKVVIR